MDFIELGRQQEKIYDDLLHRIEAILRHRKFIFGPELEEMEKTLAAYVNMPFCLAVGSGTVSLEIILRALDIGPGDEVITVPFTWISTVEVISQVGAKAVLVDIEPVGYQMNVDAVEAAITERTKAIIPVSLFGQMPDMLRLQQLADQHGIALIEDGAQSFGATHRGLRSCGASPISSTSFFPSKPLGCYGDGGAIFVREQSLADKIKAIRNHGSASSYTHEYVGLNGRMDSIQAAVILAKWPLFEKEVELRQQKGQRYTELLAGVVSTPVTMPHNTHVYAQYTIRVPERDALIAHLKQQGVPSGVYYPRCAHQQPAYANLGYRNGDFPVAERAANEVLSLPMSPYITDEEQNLVAMAIRGFYSSK
jgi:UDP-2-acetamido-2-deoxy-ribo-hexuluronate aminotransferase